MCKIHLKILWMDDLKTVNLRKHWNFLKQCKVISFPLDLISFPRNIIALPPNLIAFPRNQDRVPSRSFRVHSQKIVFLRETLKGKGKKKFWSHVIAFFCDFIAFPRNNITFHRNPNCVQSQSGSHSLAIRIAFPCNLIAFSHNLDHVPLRSFCVRTRCFRVRIRCFRVRTQSFARESDNAFFCKGTIAERLWENAISIVRERNEIARERYLDCEGMHKIARERDPDCEGMQ